jgi:hypothetical protein
VKHSQLHAKSPNHKYRELSISPSNSNTNQGNQSNDEKSPKDRDCVVEKARSFDGKQ